MLTSIIINNYNYGHFLNEAIDSALNQTYPNIEVIVVDDGSADNSRDIIAEYGNRIIPVLKENGGMASAFNAGFNVSSGHVIISLDSDDLLLPFAVENAIQRFNNIRVTKVHWYLWEINKRGQKSGTMNPKVNLPEGDLRDEVIKNGPVACVSSPTSGNAWSRKFLEKVLPIPELEFKRSSDSYLYTLAPIYGSVERITEPQGYYRIHSNNDYAGKSLGERNKLIYETFEVRCNVLIKHLNIIGIKASIETWKKNENYKWIEQLYNATNEIAAIVPPGEIYLFVDDGQWEAGNVIADRQNLPFLESNGEYWGPPPDDETAIREFERLRKAGASFIVFAWTAFWWLEHYQEFYKYLRTNYRCVLDNERLVVFDLKG